MVTRDPDQDFDRFRAGGKRLVLEHASENLVDGLSAKLRQQLTRLGLAEARKLLDAGEPAR